MSLKRFNHTQWWLWLVLWGLAGCGAQPVKPEQAVFDNIQQAYSQTIQAAHHHPHQVWHHGRHGNMVVNSEGPPHIGLCHDWQRLVYRGIRPVVEPTDWHAVGIVINEGNLMEHHAVLVYDTRRARLQDILKKPYKSDIYVLDAWRNGKPEIYTLAAWLDIPLIVRNPPRLIEVIDKTQRRVSR